MRLWSLHPRYLDGKGLVALWREGLLAQSVLGGHVRGYGNHPQLARFRDHRPPGEAIAFYLYAVLDEARVRGYRFDPGKIEGPVRPVTLIEVTEGQLRFEVSHLAGKLARRDPEKLRMLGRVDVPRAHSSFVVVPGPVAWWEKGSSQ